MMKKFKITFLQWGLVSMLFVFLLTSCEPKWKEADLHGSWIVSSWTEKSTGKSVGDKMDFTFKKGGDKRYSIDYGAMKEEGKYWIEYDYLITVEDGSVAKKVKIISMSPDKLEFDMNRSGRLESLILARAK